MIDFCFIAVLLVIPRWWFGGDFFCCQGEDVGCPDRSPEFPTNQIAFVLHAI